MKKDMRLKYNECSVKCVCGNAFITKSTLTEISVEVCGACHPMYTGKQKIVDSTGRVERFQKMIDKKGPIAVRSKAEKRARKSEKKIESKSKIKDTEKKSEK